MSNTTSSSSTAPLSTAPLALVIGATGGVGGEVARVLLARGWRVRALSRNPEAAARGGDLAVEWVKGDAMDAASVAAAAMGAGLIVHGANPPGYRNWAGTVVPMIDNTIAAAKATGARILFPGTVYNYGRETFPLVGEAAPQKPRTRKGLLRVIMEQRLAAASRDGVRVLIVRAGDFFGPRSSASSWFGQGLVQAGKPVAMIMNPGRRGVGHAWAYLPDLAEAMVRLCERGDQLADFELFHFGGHWLERGEEMVQAIQGVVRQASGRKPPIIPFPWPVVTLLSPVVALFREMAEMRYLWREPLRLDNAKLVSVLGREPHTPLDQAVRAALEGQGCLKVGAAAPVAGRSALKTGVA
ncbi:MAG TPA: NAD-dependent epimerase/dehydratase family protein [Caulobacteraceae bacterium]|jgi:nucleoside-diphosphate-sugar epimerase